MSQNARWSDLVSLDKGRTIAAANQLLPMWVSLIIVVLIGWQLARIAWMLVPGTEAGTAVQVPAGVSVQTSRDASGDPRSTAANISEARIFGEAPEVLEGPVVMPEFQEDLAETREQLTLKGTHASGIDEFSIAIIADSSNEDKVYAVGDPVTSRATLHAVEATRVILNENGNLTELNLPVEYTARAPSRVRTNIPTRQATTQDRKSIQSVVASNVSRLADVIRPTPYFSGGQQQGYRVYPGRDRRQFAALGLRPGDLIKEIDGQSLTDPKQAMQIFQSLGTAQQVSVTVERNGTQETLVLKTEQLELGQEATD